MNGSVASLTAVLPLAAALLFPIAGQAGQYGREHYQAHQDYAQVISARPILREVRIREPRQECYDERVVYRDEYQSRHDRDGSRAERTLGTVIGGVIGGAIGHQIGDGSGRKIATAIGAVIGADVGRNAVRDTQRNAYRGDDRGYRESVAYEPRCHTVESARYEQRIEGYDVTYRYNGQDYTTQMPYDPGSRLPVQVDVSPLRY